MTTEIEKTKRALYDCLDRIRRAAKHRALTAEFEERLEEHFEELRKARVSFDEKIDREIQRRHGEALGLESRIRDLERGLGLMTEERDDIQGRLHAIDHAYCEQSNLAGAQTKEIERLNDLNRIAGQELIRVQGIARQHLDDVTRAGSIIRANKIEIESLRSQLEARDKTIGELRKNYGRDRQDLMDSEKLSDELSEKLAHATTVIGQQEQLIAGQRHAIAELFGLKNRKSSVVKCAHEFHPAFPGGERCVYCLEKKLTAAGETIAQMERYRSELCTNPTHISSCNCGRG